jgi:hypothetical protein
MNIDELIAKMKEDELSDQKYMTPVQYSKTRPIRPQVIYSWIRKGLVEHHICDCGRKVIEVEVIDEIMRSKGRLPPVEEADEDEAQLGPENNEVE